MQVPRGLPSIPTTAIDFGCSVLNAQSDTLAWPSTRPPQSAEVVEGDRLELGAFITEDQQRVRTSHTVQVLTVVPNEGQGAMAGSQSPAVFADLATAQTMLGMEGRLNRMALAFKPSASDDDVRAALDGIEAVFDDVLTSEDVGLVWTTDATTSSRTPLPRSASATQR